MIPHIKNLKDSTKKLLEMINDLSKVTGYIINGNKSVAFLHTNNEAAERELRVSFKIAPRTIKYLGISLAKEVRDLHSGNYKTLMKNLR